MKKKIDTLVETAMTQIVMTIVLFGRRLNGQDGYALVGLAMRPGCSVVDTGNGRVFNYRCAN